MSLFGFLELPLTILQVVLILGVGYATFSLLPPVTRELKTKFWISQSNVDIYFDKWDYVHFGTSMMGALYWLQKKHQMFFACAVIFAVAIGFELYEQLILCQLGWHPSSCEPIWDTGKDLVTCSFGLLVALLYPENGLVALGHNEVLIWNLAFIVLTPHKWWFELIFYPASFIFAAVFYTNEWLVRSFYFGTALLRLGIRLYDNDINAEFVGSLLIALFSVALTSKLLYWLEEVRANIKSNDQADEKVRRKVKG